MWRIDIVCDSKFLWFMLILGYWSVILLVNYMWECGIKEYINIINIVIGNCL